MSIATISGQRSTQLAVIIIGLALLYVLTGSLSLVIAPVNQLASPTLFFPEGIALAAALRFGPAVWPGVLIGQILLGELNNVALPASFSIGVINSLEIILGVVLFRRLKGNPALLTIRDLAILLGLILFVLQPFSATFSLWSMQWLHSSTVITKSTFWLHWWFGNVLSQIIITPLLLSLTFHRKSDNWINRELIPLGIALAALSWLLLMRLPPISPALPFAVFTPLLVIVALRYGIGPGSAATFLVASMTLLAEYVTFMRTGNHTIISMMDLNIFLLGIVPAVQSIAILSRQQLRSASNLNALERQYQRVFEQAPVFINAFDPSGKFLLWNNECARAFGYSREEILQHNDPLSLFYPKREDRDMILKLDHYLNRPLGLQELRPLRRDKMSVSSLWTSVPMSDGIVFNIGVDITERKQTEARLRIAASVFEHSYDGIVIVNPEKTIVDINPAGAGLLGYEEHELRGQALASYRPNDYSAQFYSELWSSVELSDSWQGEVWMQHRTRGKRPLNTNVICVRDVDQSILRYIVVFTDISELKTKEAELQRMAHFDSLTGLPNRYLLNEKLHQGMLNAKRSKQMMAVCYLDLDGFKQVNDNLGHDAGDAVLIEVAQRIQTALRRKDTVARMGGDEMALLLTNLNSPEDSREVLDRVLSSVAQPIVLPDGMAQVSASIGVSFFHQDGATFDILLSKADTAMYQAKRAGKNRYHFYSTLDHSVAVAASQT